MRKQALENHGKLFVGPLKYKLQSLFRELKDSYIRLQSRILCKLCIKDALPACIERDGSVGEQ